MVRRSLVLFYRRLLMDSIKAAYAIAVRSSEYDLPPELLDDIVARTVSIAGGGNEPPRRKRGREDDDEDEYDA